MLHFHRFASRQNTLQCDDLMLKDIEREVLEFIMIASANISVTLYSHKVNEME